MPLISSLAPGSRISASWHLDSVLGVAVEVWKCVFLRPFGVFSFSPSISFIHSVCCPSPFWRVALRWSHSVCCYATLWRVVRIGLHSFDAQAVQEKILDLPSSDLAREPTLMILYGLVEGQYLQYVKSRDAFSWYASQIGCNHIPRASSWLIRYSTTGWPYAPLASGLLKYFPISNVFGTIAE